jgi:hypothetical protein
MIRGQVVHHRYVIQRVLGRGSFGVTYLATDTRLGDLVALKVLDLTRLQDWKAFEHFESEAAVLKRLDHPRIPRFVDAFETKNGADKLFCVAQQLAAGTDLQTLSDAGWRAEEDEARHIAVQVLRVLSYLHARGVVHRDVKPSNLVRDDGGRVRLVDFGGAREIRATRSGSTLIGTFGYMAPEQIRGRSLPASDLHALGATIVLALTGRSPAELPQRRLQADLRAEPRIPAALRPWLKRMLAPALEDRFASADDALRALLRPRAPRPYGALAIAAIVGVGACALLGATLRAEASAAPSVTARARAPHARRVVDEDAEELSARAPASVAPTDHASSTTAPLGHALGYTSSLRPVDRFEDDSRRGADPLYLQLGNAEIDEVVDSVWKGDAEERQWLTSRIARPMAIAHRSRSEIRTALVTYLRSIGARRVRSR